MIRRALSGGVAIAACLVLLGAAVLALVVEVSLATPASLVIAAFIATSAIAVAGLVDPARLVATLRAGRLFLPVAAYVITVSWIGSSRGSLRFDEIGAQVIAVLALALALDARYFRLDQTMERLEVLSSCFVILLLGIGELYALRGVFGARPHHGEVVAGAIAAGFVGVAVSALVRPLEQRATDSE